MRIAVFCPNLVGDTVMATPTLRALRDGYPEARILGVLKPICADTLEGTGWFDALQLCDPRSRLIELRTDRVIAALRREAIDLAVLLPNSFRSAWIAARAGINRRVGYARGARDWLLTDPLRTPRRWDGSIPPYPILDHYLELAAHLGCPIASKRTELRTTVEDESRAESILRTLGLARAEWSDRPLVCLNTGGAFGPSKNWPIDHFITLARRLVDEQACRVLVLCGPQEEAHARQIAEGADRDAVRSLAGHPLSIGLSKACVRRASLLVTTDSGPRHFAQPFRVPVITLYGPTHVAWTRTYDPSAVHIQKSVPCGPCQRPTCRWRHHRCMTELSPEFVYEQAVPILDRARRGGLGRPITA